MSFGVNLELLKDLLEEHTGWELKHVYLRRTPNVRSDYFWIEVAPDHRDFWDRFKDRFDPSNKQASQLGAIYKYRACPEFPSIAKLFTWLNWCTGDETFRIAVYFG